MHYKNILLIIVLIFSIKTSIAQCPTGDVILYTQEDVDNFINDYPMCEVINGDLIIGDETNDISGITSIKRIEGTLSIRLSEINNVSNFSNLEFIGGDFQIDQSNFITSIEGINKLQTVKGNFEVTLNNSLITIDGFDELNSVEGGFSISINILLVSIPAFENLIEVGQSVVILKNSALKEIKGFNRLLTNGGISILENSELLLIDGFNSLTKINGNFEIWDNIKLISLLGFVNLEEVSEIIYIGGLLNVGNFSLVEIPPFDNLKTIGTSLEINYTKLRNIDGFNNVEVIGNLNPIKGNLSLNDNNSLLNITGFNLLAELKGDLEISGSSKLVNIIGFSALSKIRGLNIISNEIIPNLSGLESLLTVGVDGLLIKSNLALIDCSALCNLFEYGTINGPILFEDNPSDCSSEAEVRGICALDFDGDILLDDDDLDDDNDGILDITEQNGDVNRDSDGDGFPDHRDLDSDNDGCYDTVEAGFIDGDNNGTLGSFPDTVDGDGLIIGEPDGYTSPLDANFDTIYDFQQDNVIDAGEDGELEICINSSSVNLIDSLTDSPDSGGIWTPSLFSGTGEFDPSVDSAGTYTYTVTNGICGTDTSKVEVMISLLPNAGEDGDLETCIDSGSVNLIDSLTGTPDIGGVWTPILFSGTGEFDPAIDTGGTYTYTVSNGSCDTDTSEVEILINLLPNAGEDGNLGICTNCSSVNLFDSLLGTPDSGGVWSPSLFSGNGEFDPSVDTAGTYTYTVANSICGSDTSEVEVLISLVPNAGENGNLEICIDSNSVNLFDSLLGTPDSGGVWVPSLFSGTGEFDPSTDTAGTYTYTVTNGISATDTSEVEVLISALPNAGENGSLEICINNNPINLFDSLFGSPNSGGIWTPSLLSGTGEFDPSFDIAGTYTYTVTNGSCGTDTSEVEVAVTNVSTITNFNIDIIDVSVNHYNIIINITPSSNYLYSIDGINFQTQNSFNNIIGGNYKVFATEIDGCNTINENIYLMFFPNFFTPNNDSFNDVWNVEGLINQSFNINIFNRFGKVITQFNHLSDGWDGTYNGEKLPSSDYWYVVTLTDGRVFRGHFTLKR